MVALAANLSAEQEWIPLSAADALSLPVGYYTIDTENVFVDTGAHRADSISRPTYDGRRARRGVGGSTAATHLSGATLTAYDPEAPSGGGGGSGIPNPFTEDVDPNGFNIRAAADGTSQGGRSFWTSGAGANGGSAEMLGGNTSGADTAGDAGIWGGTNGGGGTGGNAFLYGGDNDDGDAGARVDAQGGSPGVNGRIKIQTDNATGASGDLLTAQGDGTALWAAPTGGLTSVTIDLSAADIATLNSVPVEVVAAPGAGKVIVPVAASFQFKAGAVAFAGAPAVLSLGGSNIPLMESPDVAVDDTTARVVLFGPVGAPVDIEQPDIENQTLMLSAGSDPIATGSILTASLGVAGTGYAPGDTGTVESEGTEATYEIDTVGGGGEVATFTIMGAGTEYIVESGVATAVVTGAGDGQLSIDIATITPLSDGTARLTVLYYVMDLLV